MDVRPPPAQVFGPQLLWVVDQLSEQLDDLASDAAARVGGNLWFGASSRRATDHEGSG